LAWLASLTLSITEGRGFESPPQFQRLKEENTKALGNLASEIIAKPPSIQQNINQMKITNSDSSRNNY
jgi:hypothetical protein